MLKSVCLIKLFLTVVASIVYLPNNYKIVMVYTQEAENKLNGFSFKKERKEKLKIFRHYPNNVMVVCVSQELFNELHSGALLH